MKIEAGKFYKTRDDRKVGPIHRITEDEGFHPDWKWRAPYPCGADYWTEDGLIGNEPKGENDLVSEWPDEGPVRTVTRKEIVPGVYGRVEVMARNDIGVPVHISWPGPALNADELRSAAMIFSQLAEALEDQQ